MKSPVPLYTINNLDTHSSSTREFTADSFSNYLQEHPNLHFPHKHSFYHFVYFSGGGGHHSIDFVKFPVEAGQIYFMCPGQVHDWNFDGEKPDGYIVNFSEKFLQSFLAHPRYLEQFSFFSGKAAEQVIQVPVSAEVEGLLQTLVEEAQSVADLKDDFVRTCLLQLFIRISRYVGRPVAVEGNYSSIILKNFQSLIDKEFKEKKLAKEYASLLHITPNHLNALSKSATGRSAGELIRDRVILEAKRLLVNAKLSASEIANELNFSDNSYFSKFFKKYTGVSPEVFRKQISKN